MAIEIGSVSLEHVTQVLVRERARLAPHAVPGLSGDLVQVLARPSVAVDLEGIFLGATAADDLKALRASYLKREPVDFFTEAVGEGYFAEVLIAGLQVAQRAGHLDEFDYHLELIEYVKPPEPPAAAPFAGIDTGLLDEATSFVDDVQNALDQVSKLADLVANVPSFGDPTTKLPSILSDFAPAAADSASALGAVKSIF